MDTNMFVPEEDVVETLPDGRTVLVAPKGVPMLLARAVALGLVSSDETAEPPKRTKRPQDDK